MRNTVSLLLTLAVLSACGSRTKEPVESTTSEGTTTSPAGTTAASQGRSLVRLANTLTAPAALTVTADDSLLFSSAAASTVTPYQNVTGNNVTFRIRPSTIDSALAGNMELLTDGSRYTLVAMRDADGSAKLKAFRDEIVPDSGKARLRVIHAVPGLAEIDVVVPGSTDPLFDNLNYGNEGGYKDLNPGKVTLSIRHATGGAQLKQESFTLEAGSAVTLVLGGTAAKPTVLSVTDRREATTP